MLTEQDLKILVFNNTIEKILAENLSYNRGYPDPEQH